MYNLNHDNKKRRNDIYSNASITEILGINDDNLEILDNEKENIKGLDIWVERISGQSRYETNERINAKLPETCKIQECITGYYRQNPWAFYTWLLLHKWLQVYKG